MVVNETSSKVGEGTKIMKFLKFFPEDCMAWTAEDDDIILHGKRDAIKQLKTRRKAEDIAKRRTFLLSHMRD